MGNAAELEGNALRQTFLHSLCQAEGTKTPEELPQSTVRQDKVLIRSKGGRLGMMAYAFNHSPQETGGWISKPAGVT